jgi:hypothetical protein
MPPAHHDHEPASERRQEEVMVAYHRSTPGRLAAVAVALPLLTGAVFSFQKAALSSHALPLVGGLAIMFFAMGLGVDDYRRQSFTALLTLPFAVFFYLALVGIAVPVVLGLVYVMAIAGCALLTIAVRPGLPSTSAVEVRRERTV